ncbi:HTH domain-containing protein [Aerococcus loyolae]|nr:HTH domain-containing protein [Aerococcus loyolae]
MSMEKEISERLVFLDDKPRLRSIFLLLFRSEGYITSQMIAEKLGVTSRTVKSDIKELSEGIVGLGYIKSKRAHGYRLVISDSQCEKQIKSLFQIFPSPKVENYKLNHILYILRRLMTSSSGVRLEDLQEELLTTSSLQDEISEVKKLITKYGLKLITRPKIGMKVRGPGFKKVMLTIRAYWYFDQHIQSQSGLVEFDNLFECSKEEKEQIRQITLTSITKSRIVFSDLNLERFILYLIYGRNNFFKTKLDLPKINFDETKTDEYRVVIEILNKLSSRMDGFDFTSEYVRFLTYIAVMSTDLYRFADCSYDNYNGLLAIAQESRNFLLRKISDYLQIEFLDDYTCFKDTLKIMLPISIKMWLNVSDSIDMRYKDFESSSYNPILKYFVVRVSKDFFKRYGYEMSKREQDLIFTTFLGVLNRINLDIKKLRIAIIAIDGRLSTQQLKFNLQHYFSEFIEKIDTKTLYELTFNTSVSYDYYLCPKIGKNLLIPQKPIYFVKDDISEFNYDDSFRQIFFKSYCYDQILPPIELVQEEKDDQNYDYIVDIIHKEGKIRFKLSLTSPNEQILVYRPFDSEYIISVGVNIQGKAQKLKMLMNVLNRMVQRMNRLSSRPLTYSDLLND